MRILFFSNAPWARTGYGVQTRYAMQYLPAGAGETGSRHELAIACNYGLSGARLVTSGADGGEGVRFYPNGYDRYSNDIVQAHADDFKAEVIVSLYDVWPLKLMDLRTPWLPWTLVDHEPLIESVATALKAATRPVACSQFGQRLLWEAGFENAAYVQQGTDLSVFRPGPEGTVRQAQLAARERLGLPADAWIAGMVAANKSYPTRKNFPQVLAAWHGFKERHPDALLYLHTEEQGVYGGIDLRKLITHFGFTPRDVLVCDQYRYVIGFPDPYMVDVYNAMDVLLNPAMCEGFGVPIVEAQACGTPVIGCENSSMPELVKGGLLVAKKDCERWWCPQGGWDYIPHESAVLEAMETVYQHPEMKNAGLHDEMWSYDWRETIAPAWDALLREMQPAFAERAQLAAYGL